MKTITVHGLQFNVWETSFCVSEPGICGPVIYIGREVDLMKVVKGVAQTINSAMECQHATDVAALTLAGTNPRNRSNP